MASVKNTVTIAGPIEAVFDLATTAGYWPQWHPATIEVGGVTRRPYQLGDHVHERGRVAGFLFRVVWTVSEHRRPALAVLRCETPPARIVYRLKVDGAATVFQRELEYDENALAPAASDAAALAQVLYAQSEEALARLKQFVEATLRAEAAGLDDHASG